MTIQDKLLEEITHKLGSKRKVARSLMDCLDISQDSVYRRTRGETLFTIDEIQKICHHFNISFDVLIRSQEKNQVFFTKRDLSDFDFSFTRYLEDILDELSKLRQVGEIKGTIVYQDLHMFKLLNFPQLTRFKFHFWSQHVVHKKDKIGEKFKLEVLGNEVWNLAHKIHLEYARIETEEIVSNTALSGIIKEIEVHFANNGFDEKDTALKLLIDLRKLVTVMEMECRSEVKKIVMQDTPSENKNYRCYLNRAFMPDNSIHLEAKGYSSVFLTHNVLNFLSTNDKKYIEDTKQTIIGFKRNSDRISGKNEELRKHFFDQLRVKVDDATKRIESA